MRGNAKVPCPTVLRLTMEIADGELFWRERKPWMFRFPARSAHWNRTYAGKRVADWHDGRGYRKIKMFGLRGIYLHRVIFALANGRWPARLIDHINGDRSDNSISNLREASPKENARNSKARGSTSRFLGVSWSVNNKNWVASCSAGGGLARWTAHFDDEETAARERDKQAAKRYGQFVRLNFPLD